MNRLTPSFLVLLFMGCADSDTQRLLGPGDARLAASASTSIQRFPIDGDAFVPCALNGAGEVIHLSGTLLVLNHATFDDNHATLRVHFNQQRLSGEGLTSGSKYQGTDVSQVVLTFAAGETYTYANAFRLIGQGPSKNLLIRDTYSFTVNANGELTAQHGQFSFECR